MDKKHEHECGCGCGDNKDIYGEMEDECCDECCDEQEIILLVDEDDNEHPFEIVFVVELDDKAYAVLNSLEEEDITVIMEMVGDDEDLELHPVEDEEELNRVIEYVNQELGVDEDEE